MMEEDLRETLSGIVEMSDDDLCELSAFAASEVRRRGILLLPKSINSSKPKDMKTTKPKAKATRNSRKPVKKSPAKKSTRAGARKAA
jgi:hypothetical protein